MLVLFPQVNYLTLCLYKSTKSSYSDKSRKGTFIDEKLEIVKSWEDESPGVVAEKRTSKTAKKHLKSSEPKVQTKSSDAEDTGDGDEKSGDGVISRR